MLTKAQYQILLEQELMYGQVSEERAKYIETELDGLKQSEGDE